MSDRQSDHQNGHQLDHQLDHQSDRQNDRQNDSPAPDIPEDFGGGIGERPLSDDASTLTGGSIPPSFPAHEGGGTEGTADGLVHSKVPLGPLFTETFTFYGRYFWRRLALFGLIVAFFSTLPSFLFQVMDGPEVQALATLSAGRFGTCRSGSCSFVATPSGMFSSEENSSKDNSSEDNSSEENSSEEISSEEASSVPAAPFVSEEEVRKAMTLLIKSPILWVSIVISLLLMVFQLMVVNWGIRTIRTGNDAWGNLKFPSVWTIPKIILATLFYCLIVTGIGCGAIIGIALAGPSNTLFAVIVGGIFLIIFFWVLLRCSMFVSFILDRNVGPIAALNASMFFMKKNVLTFIAGSVLMAILAFFLASVITFPFAAAAAAQVVLSASSGASKISESSIMMLIPQFITQMLIYPFGVGFGAVFYLMMTGRRRPGVWPRESK